MKSWKMALGISMASLAVPAAIAWIWPTRWAGLLAAAWGAGAVLASARAICADGERERQRQERALQQAAIRTLNHHRHDWMNDLQVLYGYIQLNKPDKSVQTVERIKERIALDSRISKLGIPSLVFFLQSYRTVGGNLELNVEVEEGLQLGDKLSPEAGEELTSAVIGAVRACQFGGTGLSGEPRQLSISFWQEDGDAVVAFCAEGEGLKGGAGFRELVVKNTVQSKLVRRERSGNNRMDLELRLPIGM
ncbi:Spo0B domain-containing protein [Paenibacillus sp. HN-1]|nr:Spo0B domain-containing protein [Paenibacillus sp. CGMCC 1.18879]MBY9085673.1 Spo0B domain-containing protein [Paenibacillus sinensis]